MRPYDYYIFDLDGTLIDSNMAIITGLKEMERVLGLEKLSDEVLHRFLGPSLKDSFMKYYKVSYEETEEMTKIFRECYLRVGINLTELLPGIKEMLIALNDSGIKIGIATLKQWQLAKRTLSLLDIQKYCSYTALNLNNGLGDKPALINECLKSFNCIDRRRAIMIGDSPLDGLAAIDASVDFIALGSGMGFQINNNVVNISPKYVAVNSLDLSEYIIEQVKG